MQDSELLSLLKETVRIEREGLEHLEKQIDVRFLTVLRGLNSRKGKIITTGVGKSSFVARKCAATLSSTGNMAVFLHPIEAFHGDLGLVEKEDWVLLFGKSGESDEVVTLVPLLKKLGATTVAITGKLESTLAKLCHFVLPCPVLKEACPFDMAPTASVVASLAVSDAVAMALMRMRGFEPKDFAQVHPGGALGRRLLFRVSDLMVPLDRCYPLRFGTLNLSEALNSLGKSLLGVVLVLDENERLRGILTDGDLRRALQTHKEKIFTVGVSELLTAKAQTVSPHLLAHEALDFMEKRERPLNMVPVVDEESQKVLGVLRVHDLVGLRK